MQHSSRGEGLGRIEVGSLSKLCGIKCESESQGVGTCAGIQRDHHTVGRIFKFGLIDTHGDNPAHSNNIGPTYSLYCRIGAYRCDINTVPTVALDARANAQNGAHFLGANLRTAGCRDNRNA